jgi:drug/metabolite transporter (DMT)-like permease
VAAWAAALRGALRGQSDVVRGYLWALAATLCFTIVETTAKALGRSGIDPFQITFFRCFVGGICVVPFMIRAGSGALRTNRVLGHAGRTFFGCASVALGFYAITHLEFAEAVALSYTRPLFLVVLAVLFLGETVRWRRWIATAIGFVGIIVMLRPEAGAFTLAHALAILAAFCVAVVGVLVKQLSATERPEAIIFYFGVLSSLLALPPALAVWRPLDAVSLAALCVIGVVGTTGQYFVIRAYRLVEATQIEPIDYIKLLIATAIGFVGFGEWPDVWVFVGAGIIIAATLYITRREARLARQGASTAPITGATAVPGKAV